MEGVILPRGYLSYTQWELWKKNKDRYKREYFEKSDKLDTRYLRFGKWFAELIETGRYKHLVPDLLVYPEPEKKLYVELEDGVKILAFIDSYDSTTNLFLEYKTGKVPWTQAKVQRHEQLTFYATLLYIVTGSMPASCKLIWVETKEDKAVYEGLGNDTHGIALTGRVYTFTRTFDKREIDRIYKEIITVAHEISDAYKEYLNNLDI